MKSRNPAALTPANRRSGELRLPSRLLVDTGQVTDWNLVEPKHVLRALEECDAMGTDAFLSKYGYGRSRNYYVRHDGKEYPSKPVLAVAYRNATGEMLRPVRVDGGKWGAARILRKLGFSVSGEHLG